MELPPIDNRQVHPPQKGQEASQEGRGQTPRPQPLQMGNTSGSQFRAELLSPKKELVTHIENGIASPRADPLLSASEATKQLLMYVSGERDDNANDNANNAIQALLKAGADPLAVDENGKSALMLAVSNGHVEVVDILCAAGAQLSVREKNKLSGVFIDAIQNGQSKIVSAAIKTGIEITGDFRTSDHKKGMSALMFAVSNEHLEVVNLLRAAGAQLSSSERRELTEAFINAVQNGQLKILKVLFQAGINDFMVGKKKASALMWAASHGHVEVVDVLRESGAKLSAAEKDALSQALIVSASRGELNAVKAMLEAGASISAVDGGGDTALIWAASNGHLEIVKALLKANADISIFDSEGKSALIWAAANGHVNVVEALLKVDADDLEGQGPGKALLYAARNGHQEIVGKLIDAGASLRTRDASGNTARTYAEYQGHMEIVSLLISAIDNAKITFDGTKITFDGKIDIPRANHVPAHKIKDNVLSIDVNRSDMDPKIAIAAEYLHVLAEYLRAYNLLCIDKNKNFARLSLAIRYVGEEGIDWGGVSREFLGQLFRHKYPFFQETSGTYDLFDPMLNMTAENLELCKDIGALLAALCSGFPENSGATLENVFSDKFYNRLLVIYKYAKDVQCKTQRSILQQGFKAMEQNDKEDLVLTIANCDTEKPHYKNAIRCLSGEIHNSDNLDSVLMFLVDDFVNGSDEESYKEIDPDLMEILEALANKKNYSKLLSTPESFTVVTKNDKSYTRDDIRGKLFAALSDPTKRSHIQRKFIDHLVSDYESSCIPLVAVAEGFNIIKQERGDLLIKKFEQDPQKTVSMLSSRVQGTPFTRDKFIGWLKNAYFETDDPAVHDKVNWIIEWCEKGIEGREESRATDEEMKKMLACITATKAISTSLDLKFGDPEDPEYSKFHTCFNAVSLGRELINMNDKTEFITKWKLHVNIAVDQGFLLG